MFSTTFRNFATSVLLIVPFVTGCQTINTLPGIEVTAFNNGPTVEVMLPRDWRVLGNSPAEESLRNAMEFFEQKRFIEARRILAQLRDSVSPRSQSYQAITASMAHISLRQGDIVAARRLGRQLEALVDETRPDPAFVSVIAIIRALDRRPTPVNTPKRLSQLLQNLDLPTAQKADATWTSN